MKKILISLFMISAALSLNAQSDEEILTTRKGVKIKPVAGDFAIGIDATPFFQYAGNLFSNSNPYYPKFGFTAQAPGSIFVKYKASETTTYRASILIGGSTETVKLPNETGHYVKDKVSTSALTIGLSAGIEKHRDFFGRLSGYYGAQAGISKQPYMYYDNVTSQYYYGKFNFKDGNDSNNDYTITGGNTYSISAGGILGIEFYIAPHIALMGEYGLYVNFFTQGERIVSPATGDEIINDYGGSGLEMMPASNGNLVLLFYF
jgi:hypothetical protein